MNLNHGIPTAINFYKFFCHNDGLQWKTVTIYGLYQRGQVVVNEAIMDIHNLEEYPFFTYKNHLFSVEKWIKGPLFMVQGKPTEFSLVSEKNHP
jgi:hypothetical protein